MALLILIIALILSSIGLFITSLYLLGGLPYALLGGAGSCLLVALALISGVRK